MDDIFIGNRGAQPEKDSGTHSADIPVGKRRVNAQAPRPAEEERPRFTDVYSSAPEPPRKSSDSGRPSKKGKLGRRIKALVLVIVVLFGVGTSAAFFLFSSVNYNKTGHKNNVFLDESKLLQNKRIHNILLMGVDRRNANESSRSDTMLLMSIDSRTGKIKLTSFMRDSYVYIPQLQYSTKLNAACTYGGAQMVMDTIEYNFNIKIDHYILVDFAIFKDMIDGLGGIDVEVTEKEAQYMRDKVHLKDVVSGEKVHLNGREGLWYCRIRMLDSDFMRTQRQRKVMAALIKKVRRTNVFKLYSIARDVIADVETDMTPAQLTGLAVNSVLFYIHFRIKQGSVPAEGTWSDATIAGQSVLSLDLEANKKYLEEFIYG